MEFIGIKAKERIWKRVFQENKACQIFRKITNISNPMIRTGFFSENLACFVFLKHAFSADSPFCLITVEFIYRISLFLQKPKYPTVSLKLELSYTFLTNLWRFSFITVLWGFMSLFIFFGQLWQKLNVLNDSAMK